MKTVLQNPQTGAIAHVGMVDPYGKTHCSMANISQRIMVVDATTRKPLIGAHIVNLTSKGVGTVTNDRGFFNPEFLKLQSGHQVAISFLGYGTLTLSVEQLRKTALIEMTPQTEELPGITLGPKGQLQNETNPKIPTNKVTVQPSQNEKVKKSSQWLWWAAVVVLTSTAAYFWRKTPKAKSVNV